jgi:hypothetical protein
MSYGLGPEQFVDYLIARHGLIDFVELQLRGKDPKQWSVEDWQQVTQLVWHLSERMWTPSVQYVIDMYGMQKERHRFWDDSQEAAVEKWRARSQMWKERAVTAEARVVVLEAAQPGAKRKALA